jgi:hypothetical protein
MSMTIRVLKKELAKMGSNMIEIPSSPYLRAIFTSIFTAMHCWLNLEGLK